MNVQSGTATRRPAYFLVILIISMLVLDGGLLIFSLHRKVQQKENQLLYDIATAGLGLTDLCVATEARYTRHPAVSDWIVPFMDHPGAIEHFPTGSFWAPPFLDISPKEKK